jgi:hypothetical protein
MANQDYRKFAAQLDSFMETLVPEKANLVKQKVALQLLFGVVMLTRVDTGRARGGWSVSLRHPSSKDTKLLDKGGNNVRMRGKGSIEASKPGEDIYINNPVVYVPILNDGDKNRTGDHMVERTMARVGAQFA